MEETGWCKDELSLFFSDVNIDSHIPAKYFVVNMQIALCEPFAG